MVDVRGVVVKFFFFDAIDLTFLNIFRLFMLVKLFFEEKFYISGFSNLTLLISIFKIYGLSLVLCDYNNASIHRITVNLCL